MFINIKNIHLPLRIPLKKGDRESKKHTFVSPAAPPSFLTNNGFRNGKRNETHETEERPKRNGTERARTPETKPPQKTSKQKNDIIFSGVKRRQNKSFIRKNEHIF